MSKYDRDIQDVYAVKQLGDAIGYGHLMAIAHELWARHLEDKGLPRSGAHCVVGYPMVKEEYQTEALNDPIYTIVVDKALNDPIYTIVVDKALADRKTEPQYSEDDMYWLSLAEDVANGKMSDAGANQAWLEYINHKDEPTISKMEQVEEPQTETQTETQNSNLTFEKRTMRDCYNCKRYETEGECVECHYEPKDEPQTERSE